MDQPYLFPAILNPSVPTFMLLSISHAKIQGFVSYFICSPSNIHLKSGPLHMVYPEPQWHIPVFPTAIALAYKHVAHLCHSATDELQLFTLKQMLLKDKNVTTIFAFHECLVKCLLYSALSAH